MQGLVVLKINLRSIDMLIHACIEKVMRIILGYTDYINQNVWYSVSV